IMPVLLGGRAFQGLGAGVLTTVVYAVVHATYPRRQWPQILALLSAAWAVSGLCFPWLLGLVVQYLHWRMVFVFVLPVLACAILWVLPSVPASPQQSESESGARIIDAVGIVFGASL